MNNFENIGMLKCTYNTFSKKPTVLTKKHHQKVKQLREEAVFENNIKGLLGVAKKLAWSKLEGLIYGV